MTSLAFVTPTKHQPLPNVHLTSLVYLTGTLEHHSPSGEMKLVCAGQSPGLAKLYEIHGNGLCQHIAKIILEQFYESVMGTMMKTPFINKDAPTAGPWSAVGVMKMLQIPDLSLGGNQRLRSRIATAIESNTDDKVVVSAMGYRPYSVTESISHSFINDCGQRVLNTFVRSDITPEFLGDAALFTNHIEYLCDHDTNQTKHIIDWLAHSIQNPDTKIGHAILLGSREGGTGKSLLLNTMATLMNRTNANTINVKDLRNSKQDWLIDKTLVIVEEVKDLNLSDMNNLKTLITEPTIMVDKKFATYQQERNHANFIFTSNFERSLYLPDSANARRYFVVFSEQKPRPAHYYKALANWLEHENGYSIVLGFLLERNLNHFDAMAPPPDTAAKALLISNSKTDFQLYVHTWANGSDYDSNAKTVKVFAYESLESALSKSPYSHERGKARRISEFLVSAGCTKKRVSLPNGKVKTLWFNQVAVEDGLLHMPYTEFQSLVIDDSYPF
jgi:hypothetical protein